MRSPLGRHRETQVAGFQEAFSRVPNHVLPDIDPLARRRPRRSAKIAQRAGTCRYDGALSSEDLFMNDLSAFPVTHKWPAQHPERLQLYSLPTPNGVKVSIMLEEIGLPYEPHLVNFATNDQLSAEFITLNPNNKIPAILDPDGPGGKPLPLFESGAILIYLAEKTGQLLPPNAGARYQAIQWLMFQMGGIGPMFGQVGFFNKFAGKDYADKRPRDRYVAESKRLLGVLDRRLAGRAWIMGDAISIADIATFPWIDNLIGFYEAGDLVDIASFPEVTRVLRSFMSRPAVARGTNIPARVK
jgi:GST-like protein